MGFMCWQPNSRCPLTDCIFSQEKNKRIFQGKKIKVDYELKTLVYPKEKNVRYRRETYCMIIGRKIDLLFPSETPPPHKIGKKESACAFNMGRRRETRKAFVLLWASRWSGP